MSNNTNNENSQDWLEHRLLILNELKRLDGVVMTNAVQTNKRIDNLKEYLVETLQKVQQETYEHNLILSEAVAELKQLVKTEYATHLANLNHNQSKIEGRLNHLEQTEVRVTAWAGAVSAVISLLIAVAGLVFMYYEYRNNL